MRSTVSIFALVLLIWGCRGERSSLVPKPRQVRNELVQISCYEPNLSYSRYLYFDIDIQNLTAQPLVLQTNDGQLITPAKQSYSRLEESEAIAAVNGSFGYVAISLQTDEKIHVNSEEYIREYLLKTKTIPPRTKIRNTIVFPYPVELQGSVDKAFRGVYRIIIDGWIKGERQIPFPELTWNADSTRTSWAAWKKHIKK
jgi:hypothetical protein